MVQQIQNNWQRDNSQQNTTREEQGHDELIT